MHVVFLLGGATLLMAPAAHAQSAAPLNVDQHSIWTIQGENDSVSTTPGGSDKYYTSGLRLGWTSGANQVPDAVTRLGATFWGDGVTRVSFDLTQQIFTPNNIFLLHPVPTDRPVAAYLAGTFSLWQDTTNARSMLALSLGVIGPGAFGRQVQNGFHELIGDRINQGWGSQLPGEPAVEMLAGRTWRVGLADVAGLEFDTLPTVTASVGTVRDDLQSGVVLRAGQGLESDFGVARITPGMSGGDAFSAQTAVPWYIFAGASGQVVARDAFLDGDIWHRSASVQRNWLLGEMEVGVAIIWHGTRISYTQTWQTASFNGQKGGLFNFGSLTASFAL